ncbi:MAG: tyrosine-type recombinase/integrase [Caldilineaceae bacterium]|nr:tyrosine-type recombinase/integrase [Caldilineaceae bacterium]
MNQIVNINQKNPITGPARFDTSILAGTKSPNTIEQYRMHFASYCDFAGTFDTATDPATLAQWRRHLFETGYTAPSGEARDYSVNAINQRLAAIRGVMAEAAQQGYIEHSTAERFKAVKGLKQAAAKDRRNAHARTKISREDMQRIIDAPDITTPAGMMHRSLLLTLATSGVRISEAVTLKLSQIEWYTDEDGESGWVIYVAGKNQVEEKPRALGTKARIAIDEWLKTRAALGIRSEYIFTGFSGRGSRNPSDKPISRQAAWQTVQRYAKALDLAHIKPHDFRRYVGTQLASKDIRLAQNQLGHKRIETTAQNYILDSVKVGVTDDLV